MAVVVAFAAVAFVPARTMIETRLPAAFYARDDRVFVALVDLPRRAIGGLTPAEADVAFVSFATRRGLEAINTLAA